MAVFDIPDVPGVPALPRGSVSLFVDIPLLLADAIQFFSGFSEQRWGIFQDGVSVVEADNVVSVEFKNDLAISDYPLEEGGFENYNKVNNPFTAIVTFSSGGSEPNRQALLDSIEEIIDNTELYDIVMPERVYTSVNLAAYEYRRTATNGVGLMQIRVRVTEIRVTAQSEFSSTKDPTASATTDNGTVQPQSTTTRIIERGPDLEQVK